MTMDYLISLEIAAIGGYLFWLGRKLCGLAQNIKFPEYPAMYLPPEKEVSHSPAKSDMVEIIKVLEDGSITKIRDEHVGHSDIQVVWRTPDLGIRHPDGRVQMTPEEDN